MIHGVAVQYRAAQRLQRLQGAGLSGPGAAGDADDHWGISVNEVEARRFFQPIPYRQTQPLIIGTLGENLRHVRSVEGAQSVEHPLGLRQLGP